MNLDDIEDDDDDQEGLLDYNHKSMKPRKHSTAEKQQRSERRMKAEDDSSLLDDKDDKNGKDFDNLSSWSDNTAQQNLFKIKESMDKGLADMETGSEVYMSELLAGFDMEDLDEADDANEEDLLLLGDEFAKIDNLSTHILNRFNEFITNKNLYKQGKAYVQYCIN